MYYETHIVSSNVRKSEINTMRRWWRRRRRGWAGPRINETQGEVDAGQGGRHWERDERKTRLLPTFRLLWEIFCLQTIFRQHERDQTTIFLELLERSRSKGNEIKSAEED